MSEADLMRRLQMAATRMGARLFRQNVGLAWIGKVERGPPQGRRTVHLGPGDVVIRKARAFHAGVAGMSDLGGWMSVQITPSMVGQRVALCVQLEVKDRARPTPEQQAWISAVMKAGGRAGIVRNEQDVAAILGVIVNGEG